jgi:hypothetical protein
MSLERKSWSIVGDILVEAVKALGAQPLRVIQDRTQRFVAPMRLSVVHATSYCTQACTFRKRLAWFVLSSFLHHHRQAEGLA